ncbi:MAG: CZB domain-containing protein [Alphaproteobacteria bacterium]|nr:CZB domain-containing protein [Alphaproteobacteria bacterium]
MNLDQATKTHVDWKLKLRNAAFSQAHMDVASVRSDCACEFGKWLHGEGRARFGDLQSFKDTVASHAEFHRQAALVAALINEKKFAEVEKAIGPGSTYERTSRETVVTIMRLKRDVATAA